MKKFALLLMLTLMALALGTILLYTDAFILEEIEVVSGWISEGEILERAQLSPGQNLFFLDKYDVLDSLKEDFRIKEIGFKKVYPHKLLLVIQPKTPYVKLSYNNDILILDDEKILIDRNFDYPNLPYLKDFSIGEAEMGQPLEVLDKNFLQSAFDLVELCHQASMKDIVIWEERGLMFLHLGEGFKAAFGNGEHMELKFNNFYAVYEDLKNKGIEKGTINLTNTESPTFLPFN